MKAIKQGDRVVATANRDFCGVVVEAADDGQSGYVDFDADEAPGQRTFFHASELEPEKKK